MRAGGLRDLLLLAARLVLGGVFLALAPGKIADPATFLKDVHEYGVVPAHLPGLLTFVAVVLPWVECVGGAFLVLGVLRRGTAAVLTASLAAFTAAILFRGLAIQAEQGLGFCQIAFDCGCGTGVVPICRKLAENSALILLGLVLVSAGPDRWTLQGWSGRR